MHPQKNKKNQGLTLALYLLIASLITGCGNIYQPKSVSDNKIQSPSSATNHINDTSNTKNSDIKTNDSPTDTSITKDNNKDNSANTQGTDQTAEQTTDKVSSTNSAIGLLSDAPSDSQEPYITDIVVVAPDETMWRVVDKYGRIFRISTNSTNVSIGSISKKVEVTPSETDYDLKLTTGFSKNNDVLFKEVPAEQAGQAIATALFDDYQKNQKLIDTYSIKHLTQRSIGKGIQIIDLTYTFKSTQDASSTEERFLTFALFGYDTYWVLPEKIDLF